VLQFKRVVDMEIVKGSFFIYNGNILSSDRFDDRSVVGNGAVYEVFRVIDSKPLFIEQHTERLKNSFKAIGENLWVHDSVISSDIKRLIDSNTLDTGNIKMVFHTDNSDYYIYVVPHKYPTNKQYSDGVKVITYDALRENPNIKLVNRELRESVNRKIADESAYEALLVDNSGYITEGSRSNVFFIIKNKVYTPPVEAVLPGITRANVIMLSKKLGFNVIEDNIKAIDIIHVDAIFITGTSPGILPVVMVDDYTFSTQSINLMRLMQSYRAFVKDYISKY
jgi:branched-chain amino acid aminotransferase